MKTTAVKKVTKPVIGYGFENKDGSLGKAAFSEKDAADYFFKGIDGKVVRVEIKKYSPKKKKKK